MKRSTGTVVNFFVFSGHLSMSGLVISLPMTCDHHNKVIRLWQNLVYYLST